MAIIPQYRQQRTIPGSTGQALVPIQSAGQGAGALAQAAGQISGVLTEAADRLQRREDFINRSLAAERYQTEAMQSLQTAMDTEDIRNPSFLPKFNSELRAKRDQILMSFRGSADARAQLQAQLEGSFGQVSRSMIGEVHKAQKQFVFDQNKAAIMPLLDEVYENPGMLSDALMRADEVISASRDVLTPAEEFAQVQAAQDMVFSRALDSFVDRGMYREAQTIIDQNPTILAALSPDKQRGYMREITNGINQETERRREVELKIEAYRSAAEAAGIRLSPAQLFSAATGVNFGSGEKTPATKVNEFAALTGMDPNKMSPAVIAKVGFGIDLPEPDAADPNKSFGPDGMLTAKGVGETIKPAVTAAAAARSYYDKVDGAIQLFKETGNKQALLSAMISFQKALDDGAVVREGDIVLMRSAEGLSGQIKSFLDRIEGQAVSNEMVDQMNATMSAFTNASLMSQKAFIDPYLADADQRGFRRLDLGFPLSSYEQIFGNMPSPNARPGDMRPAPQPQTQPAPQPSPTANLEGVPPTPPGMEPQPQTQPDQGGMVVPRYDMNGNRIN